MKHCSHCRLSDGLCERCDEGYWGDSCQNSCDLIGCNFSVCEKLTGSCEKCKTITGVVLATGPVKLKIVEAIRTQAVRKLTEEYVGAVKMANGDHHASLIVRRTVLMNNVNLVMETVYRVLMALGVALVMKHAMVINVNLAIGRRDNARNAKPDFGALDAIKHAS